MTFQVRLIVFSEHIIRHHVEVDMFRLISPLPAKIKPQSMK